MSLKSFAIAVEAEAEKVWNLIKGSPAVEQIETIAIEAVESELMAVASKFLGQGTPLALIAVLLFAHGLSRSMQFTAISTLAFVDVPKDRIGSANGFFTVMTQMSMGMGVAVGAVTLRLAAWMRAMRSPMVAIT